MLNKGEFQALYDYTVGEVKKLKANNDQLNKEMGVENQIKLCLHVEDQTIKIQSVTANIVQALAKLEKNYLDPDTARKMGMIRQQFRIQQDRRKQLMKSLEDVKKTPAYQRHTRKTTNTEQEPNQKKTVERKQQPRGENYYRRKPAEAGAQEAQAYIQEQQDSEMQRKLLQERGEYLKTAHKKINEIHGIVKDAQNLVYCQGEKLDMIGDELFSAHDNIELANTQLKKANAKHKISKKRTITLIVVILVILGAAGFFLLVM